MGQYFAEKSHTRRHLTEFTGLDFEMGAIESEHDVMDVIENYFANLIPAIKEKCKAELELLEVELADVSKGSIPRLTMTDVKAWLKETQGKALTVEDDLDSEAETMLGNLVKEKYGSDFVFVTNYPWDVRPFYHMKPENGANETKSFDLLFRGVEIATGAQREHRLEVLENNVQKKELIYPKCHFTEIFSDMAVLCMEELMGLDRITSRLLNLDNVREAILLPRDPDRLTP